MERASDRENRIDRLRSEADSQQHQYEQYLAEHRGSDGRGSRRLGRPVLVGAALALGVTAFMGARNRMQNRQGQSSEHQHWQGTREAKKQTLLTWLDNAYSMEKSIAQTLKGHASDAKHHPEIRQRLERHIEETRRHADMVKARIESMGGSVSAIKSGLSTVMGAFQGVGMMPAKDSVVKDILADSAAEQLEIASYRGIAIAADEIGDIQTGRMAREIIAEEEQMLEWLQQHLPNAVRDQMAHT